MRKGFTLIEIVIIIVILGIMAVVVIPRLAGVKMTSNESLAQANLRTIAAAMETYASEHNGEYPDNTASTAEEKLTTASPSYLNRSFNGNTLSGYTYTYSNNTATTYTVTAVAASCGSSGSKDYTLTQTAEITSANCS